MNSLSLVQVRRQTIHGALVLPLMVLAGCMSSHTPSSGTPSDTPGAGDPGYALLFDLLGDERNVAKLLLIKRERAEVRDLIKAISERSARAHQELETFAKADPRLNLKDPGLPAAELKTRESISKMRGKQLITDKSKDFELHLLLTQEEALTYGGHLAAAIAARETDPIRAKFLQQLSNDLAHLQQKVAAMLLANYTLPAAR